MPSLWLRDGYQQSSLVPHAGNPDMASGALVVFRAGVHLQLRLRPRHHSNSTSDAVRSVFSVSPRDSGGTLDRFRSRSCDCGMSFVAGAFGCLWGSSSESLRAVAVRAGRGGRATLETRHPNT